MSKKILFLTLFSLLLVGCATKKTKTQSDVETQTVAPISQTTDPTDLVEISGDSDSGNAGGLKTVYFDYNSAQLSSSTRDLLNANVKYLKEQKSVEVQVEGHCDERGGVQYNLALGGKRAETVKNYLIGLGISGARITTISFGKERPVTFGHDEDSWSKNRRANFVITAK